MIFSANKIASRRRRKESDPELPLGLGFLSLRGRGAQDPGTSGSYGSTKCWTFCPGDFD